MSTNQLIRWIRGQILKYPGLFAKTITALLSVLALLLFDEVQFQQTEHWIFVLVLGVESLVFINSISPFAIMSVVLAKNLLSQAAYGVLAMGFLSAYAANILSFYIGIFFFSGSKCDRPGTQFLPLLLTFWHPQLASIQAFDHGARGSSLREYGLKALPVAAGYYVAACVVIGFLPFEIPTRTIFIVSFLVLLLWIVWEAMSQRVGPQ